MKRCWVLAVFLFGIAGVEASAEQMPRVAAYAIDVTYVTDDPGIDATADVSFVQGSVSPKTLIFYLHGELRVDEITLDGDPVEADQALVYYQADYSSVARRFQIEMSGRVLPKILSIRYHGKINPSVVQAPSNYMRVDGEGIFLRSFLYSVWFPVFLEADEDSYPVNADITIRTPEEFMAAVTGERMADSMEDGMRISRWLAVQEDLFNLQFTARPFELMKKGGFHLYFLKDLESRATAGEILSFSEKLEDFYRTNYADREEGGQLHVVQMPRFGDISSGNMVGISDRVWRTFDPSSYSGRTLAHELVHPYVQIPLPRDSELYALVIEGFPSYFHLPAMAGILGQDFYIETMKSTQDGYVKRRQTGLDRRGRQLPPEKPLLDLTAEDIGAYKDRFVLNDRAVLFCNWLRNRMGVEEFSDFTRRLFAQETLDFDVLVAIVEASLPGSAEDINRWLRSTEFPDAFRLDRNAPD